VTVVARRAGEHVIWNLIVFGVHFIGRVTEDAFEGCIDRPHMTIDTLVPLVIVGSTVNREVMDKGSRFPSTRGMAILAAHREGCCLMVWIICCVIGVFMTTEALG